jgi:hypothetical protein
MGSQIANPGIDLPVRALMQGAARHSQRRATLK